MAVSPGIGFGEYGDHFVRMALIENEHRTRQAVRGIRRALAAGGHPAPSERRSGQASRGTTAEPHLRTVQLGGDRGR